MQSDFLGRLSGPRVYTDHRHNCSGDDRGVMAGRLGVDMQMYTSALARTVGQFWRCVILVLFVTAQSGKEAQAADDDWGYVMRPGDTLIGLAERYFTNPQAWPVVQEKNRIADPYRIPAGTRIKIPASLLRIDPVVVEVLMVNGEASRMGPGNGAGKRLVAGDFLQTGEEVSVAAASNISLRFPDGTRVLVLERSRFTLELAESLGDGELQRVRIALLEGNIESNVVPKPNGAQQYEIRTPALRMSVRGTKFRGGIDALSARSRSEVLAGRVQVSGGGRAVALGAGFGAHAAEGKSPSRPIALLAAPTFIDTASDGGAAAITRLPLRFAWGSVPGADRYRAQVLDGSQILRLDGVFSAHSARWPDLPDGRYTLRVRAINADGLEGLDAERGFILDARPEPPFARAPMAKAYGEPTHFGWTAGADNDRYHFQLARDAGFSGLVVDEAALSAPAYDHPLAPGTYFWRVARIDVSGDHGPFGDGVPFEQRLMPASPQTESPQADEDRLHFRWQQGEPGQRYQLQVSASAEFGELLFDQVTDQTSAALPRPAPGDYYMRIKAIDADGFAGPYGRAERFTVEGGTKWWLMLFLLPFVL